MRVLWPSMSDYQEAVQNPKTAFSDRELRSGTPIADALGLPKPITGGFASVYQMKCGNHKWAVRCFLRYHEDTEQRYALIGKHLKQARLPYTAEFHYLRDGIWIKGQWYPVLKMEWVEGDPLNVYVEKNLGDAKALQDLAGEFAQMVAKLRGCRIAHGDLQHGNILVVNGGLRLVDYDGMYVPSLAGMPSHELGHPNYQHPKRSDAHFGLYLDAFSSWVIYVSIMALSIRPDLWSVSGSGDERLLFASQDFKNPDFSPVLRAMERSGSEELRSMAAALRVVLSAPDPTVIPAVDRPSGPGSLIVVPSIPDAVASGDGVAATASQGKALSGAVLPGNAVVEELPVSAVQQDSGAVPGMRPGAGHGGDPGAGLAGAPRQGGLPAWLFDHVQSQPVELTGPLKVERVSVGVYIAMVTAMFRMALAGHAGFTVVWWGVGTGLAALVYVCGVRYRASPEYRKKTVLESAIRDSRKQVANLSKTIETLERTKQDVDTKEHKSIEETAARLNLMAKEEQKEGLELDNWRQKAQDGLDREKEEIDKTEAEGLRKLSAQSPSVLLLIRTVAFRQRCRRRRDRLARRQKEIIDECFKRRAQFKAGYEARQDALLQKLQENQVRFAEERSKLELSLRTQTDAVYVHQGYLANLERDLARYRKITFANYLRRVAFLS